MGVFKTSGYSQYRVFDATQCGSQSSENPKPWHLRVVALPAWFRSVQTSSTRAVCDHMLTVSSASACGMVFRLGTKLFTEYLACEPAPPAQKQAGQQTCATRGLGAGESLAVAGVDATDVQQRAGVVLFSNLRAVAR